MAKSRFRSYDDVHPHILSIENICPIVKSTRSFMCHLVFLSFQSVLEFVHKLLSLRNVKMMNARTFAGNGSRLSAKILKIPTPAQTKNGEKKPNSDNYLHFARNVLGSLEKVRKKNSAEH